MILKEFSNCWVCKPSKATNNPPPGPEHMPHGGSDGDLNTGVTCFVFMSTSLISLQSVQDSEQLLPVQNHSGQTIEVGVMWTGTIYPCLHQLPIRIVLEHVERRWIGFISPTADHNLVLRFEPNRKGLPTSSESENEIIAWCFAAHSCDLFRLAFDIFRFCVRFRSCGLTWKWHLNSNPVSYFIFFHNTKINYPPSISIKLNRKISILHMYEKLIW